MYYKSTIMLPCSLVCALLWLTLDTTAAQTSTSSNMETRILNSILDSGRYDSRVQPDGTNTTGGPVQVDVDMYVISLRDVSFMNMDYTVQVYLRTKWKDSRLRYDNQPGKVKYLNLNDPSKVWRPDLFISNEKEAHFHELLVPNTFLRIYPQGNVHYSVRLTLKLACLMDFSRFPFDTQVCKIMIASYSRNTDALVFEWKKGDPLVVNEELYLLEHKLIESKTGYCTSKTNTGDYSCLKGGFVLQRDLRRYGILVFIPCCMCVIVSWVALWLDNKATLIRVLVPLVDLVSLSSLVSRLNYSYIPKTNFTMPIDTWTGVCLTFVFIVLIEVAVVDYLVRRSGNRHEPISSKPDDDKMSGVERLEMEDDKDVRKTAGPNGGNKTNWKQGFETWLKKSRSMADKIDIAFRVLLPVLFILFLIFFFGTHLSASTDPHEQF